MVQKNRIVLRGDSESSCREDFLEAQYRADARFFVQNGVCYINLKMDLLSISTSVALTQLDITAMMYFSVPGPSC
jgi:hypothetical protein